MRGRRVPLTLDELCEFYNVPYYEKYFINNNDLKKFLNINMEDVVKYLTQGKRTWKYRQNTKLPTNFNQTIMFLVAKL